MVQGHTCAKIDNVRIIGGAGKHVLTGGGQRSTRVSKVTKPEKSLGRERMLLPPTPAVSKTSGPKAWSQYCNRQAVHHFAWHSAEGGLKRQN